MAAVIRNYVCFENGDYKARPSNVDSVEFLSVVIGSDLLEIKDTAGSFDFSGVKLTNIAVGTNASDAVVKSQLDAKLALAGGTMSGAIAMGSNKITGLASGSASGDAVEFGQYTTALALKLDKAQVGAANGAASLDSGGKIPIGQLPASLMEYQGTYNASTNTPALVDGTGVSGYFYRVQVAGTQNFGSGSQSFVVGDWVMYNGAIWQLAHSGADVVSSVNGQAGAVVLTTTNVAEGTSLYFTNARAQTAAVANSITSGVTNVAPSQDAVFTALAGKQATLTAGNGITLAGATISVNADNVTLDFSTGALEVKALGVGTAQLAALSVTTAKIAAAAVDATKLASSVAGSGLTGGAGAALSVNVGAGLALLAGAVVADYTETLTNDNAGAVTAAQIVYVKSNGHLDLAATTTVNRLTPIGIVQDASIASAAAGKVVTRLGVVVGGFTGLTVGSPVYVSKASAGGVVQSTSTFVAGDYVYVVGYARSATTVYFAPQAIIQM